jgi:ABC-type uncharacterized transport system involved in gliding motility auxiliary subunit
MAMRMNLRRLPVILYLVGLLALIASGIRYLLLPIFDLWVQLGLGVAVVAIAAAVLLDPDRIRSIFAARQGRYGTNALITSLAFIGMLAVLNTITNQSTLRLDLTEDRQFSLTDETQLLLEQLEQDVRLIGFYTPQRVDQRDAILPLLEEFELQSEGKVSYSFIDPHQDPIAADQYGINQDGSIAVVIDQASQVIDFPSEVEITSAILRLANPEERIVYFLTGHGQRELTSTTIDGLYQLNQSLLSKNYQVESLSLQDETSIPDDALLLVHAGPLVSMTSEEVELIAAYLDQGGSFVLLQDPNLETNIQSEVDPLAGYIAEGWGIALMDDLVINPESLLPQYAVGLASSYAVHPITQRLQGLDTLFPTARSLQTEILEGSSVTLTPIVFSSVNAWGETGLDFDSEEQVIEFNESEDAQGPVTLVVAGEDASTGARLVVFGDSGFAANSDFLNYGNGNLIVNCIDWAARQEQLINITPRQITQRQVIPPTRQSLIFIIFISLVLLPGAVIFMGASIWWRRRKQV